MRDVARRIPRFVCSERWPISCSPGARKEPAMIRAIALGSVAVLTLGFTWPAEYAEQSRADVATCVTYARQSSPRFDAQVRDVDLATGHVDIQRSGDDARGDRIDVTCIV